MSLEYDDERRYRLALGALVHEDELPDDMSDEDYAEWFDKSFVPGNVGCRVGPAVERITDTASGEQK